jgi:hypothetical protein
MHFTISVARFFLHRLSNRRTTYVAYIIGAEEECLPSGFAGNVMAFPFLSETDRQKERDLKRVDGPRVEELPA